MTGNFFFPLCEVCNIWVALIETNWLLSLPAEELWDIKLKLQEASLKTKLREVPPHTQYSQFVEDLTARHCGLNTLSEGLGGDRFTEEKPTLVYQVQWTLFWLWNSLDCKWLQTSWGICENSCPVLLTTTRKRHLARWTFGVTYSLQHILPSCVVVDGSQQWDRPERGWPRGIVLYP